MKRIQEGLAGAGLVLAVLGSLYFDSASPAAQTPGSALGPQAVANGETIYRDHCAVCHGDHGKGNGPAAGALTPRPTDLTKETKRPGMFPAAHVIAVLKGTDAVVAHGAPAMMIWGALFLADAHGNQATADARINDVVQFIASIQELK